MASELAKGRHAAVSSGGVTKLLISRLFFVAVRIGLPPLSGSTVFTLPSHRLRTGWHSWWKETPVRRQSSILIRVGRLRKNLGTQSSLPSRKACTSIGLLDRGSGSTATSMTGVGKTQGNRKKTMG